MDNNSNINSNINEVDRVFNRQFERMKKELSDICMPSGYLTIISKYWNFLKLDIERIEENGTELQASNISTNS